MNSSLYISATGMKSMSEGLNVISNNLANVSTVAYKAQHATFSDLIYQDQEAMGNYWGAQDDSYVAIGQVGMGVQVDAIRTNFTQGAFEQGASFTDMALSGGGFFQVTNADGQEFYTRSGNFHIDTDGDLALPSGEVLSGYPIDAEGNKGELEPIRINPFDGEVAIMPAKATTELSVGLNLGNISDDSSDAANPFFSMLQAFNADVSPALDSSEYSYAQSLQVYDAEGNLRECTLYVDGAPSSDPNSTMEYLLVSDNYFDTTTQTLSPAEALLSGTLTFDASGKLVDMSAFTATDTTDTTGTTGGTGGTSSGVDLSTWVPATLVDGKPQFTIGDQDITFDLGLTGGDWENAPASAADVAADPTLLPSMGGDSTLSAEASTAYPGYNSLHENEQDGYAEGDLSNLTISEDGRIIGSYNNGQTQDLYEIPVCRFTSQDGLYREGGNLYSHAEAAGIMEMGQAGSENYGSILSNYLETSNVDMSSEMVNMIITQRGFQSNSKVVTTADEMLQKAMEIKRN